MFKKTLQTVNDSWGAISLILLVVFCAGGFVWQQKAFGERLTAVETKQDDIGAIKTGIAVLQNDVTWIKKNMKPKGGDDGASE